MTTPAERPAWQKHKCGNPLRQDTINRIDPAMTAAASALGLDLADPHQRLSLIQSLHVWTDEAARAARDELGPDNDPLNGQPF